MRTYTVLEMVRELGGKAHTTQDPNRVVLLLPGRYVRWMDGVVDRLRTTGVRWDVNPLVDSQGEVIW